MKRDVETIKHANTNHSDDEKKENIRIKIEEIIKSCVKLIERKVIL